MHYTVTTKPNDASDIDLKRSRTLTFYLTVKSGYETANKTPPLRKTFFLAFISDSSEAAFIQMRTDCGSWRTAWATTALAWSPGCCWNIITTNPKCKCHIALWFHDCTAKNIRMKCMRPTNQIPDEWLQLRKTKQRFNCHTSYLVVYVENT